MSGPKIGMRCGSGGVTCGKTAMSCGSEPALHPLMGEKYGRVGVLPAPLPASFDSQKINPTMKEVQRC